MRLEECLMEYDKRTQAVMSQCEDGICVVELRDADGTVIHFEEPDFSETTGRKLHKVLKEKAVVFPNAAEIFAIDFAGNTFKGQF